MTEIQAYDMSRFQRMILVEGGLVTGIFWVSTTKRGNHHVVPAEVTIWDSAEHRTGRVLYSTDLIAFVKDGAVEIPPHMVAFEKRTDVLGAMGDVEAAILAVVAAFPAPVPKEETSHG